MDKEEIVLYLIFFRYDSEEDVYTPIQAGQDIVPVGVVDKVLPVSSNVCRQFEKVYFKDGKLRLRDGMELLSDEELDELDRKSIEDVGVPFTPINDEITEVEI